MSMNDSETFTFDLSSFTSVGNLTIAETSVIKAIAHTSQEVKESIMKHFFNMEADFDFDALTPQQVADVFTINTLFAIMEQKGETLDDIMKIINIPVRYYNAFQRTIKDLHGTLTSSDLDEMFEME